MATSPFNLEFGFPEGAKERLRLTASLRNGNYDAVATWFAETQTSFASIEQSDRTLQNLGPVPAEHAPPVSVGDDVVPPSGAWITAYRPGPSYRPSEAVQNCQERLFSNVVFPDSTRCPIGSGGVAQGTQNDSRQHQHGPPDLAYEVISGASSGFYFLLAPLVSLQILDEARAAVPAYASGAAKEVRQIGATDNIARESRLLRVNPDLSYVSDDFAGNERDFWN